MDLKAQIKTIHGTARSQIDSVNTEELLEESRLAYLGRKSELNLILKSIKDLSDEEKREVGTLANFIRKDIENKISNKQIELIDIKLEKAETEKIDITIPGIDLTLGHKHPIEIARRKAEQVFMQLGFSITESQELETDFYNFDGLNIPQNHPARDMWDTFWTEENFIPRTHTTSYQQHELENISDKENINLRVINFGRCFRNEATDARHEHTFYQIDGLVIDNHTNIKDLIFTLKTFFSSFFETDINVKIQPSYFPFVEPGFEILINCTTCKGKGCSTCGNSGWLEILGCGMVHPNVLEKAGIDNSKFQGFAFGMGFDRLTMIKYNINDIRYFNSADLRFLEQF